MIHAEVAQLLENTLKAGLDVLLHGPEGSGKTALCRQLAPDAPLLHALEIGSEHLALLRSAVTTANVVIIENADAKTVGFLQPFLATRTLLGTPFETRFLITAREDLRLEGAAHVRLAPIEAEGWLVWAAKNRIHPSLRLLVENDERILARHNLRKLEALSKLLSARPSGRHLRAAIESVLGQDEAATLALLSSMSEPSLHSASDNAALIEKARTGTQEHVRQFESELLGAVMNGGSREVELRFVHYVRESEPEECMALLGRLITNPKAQNALDRALDEPRVKAMIDSFLGEAL